MSGRMVEKDGVWMEPPGYAALWAMFGCSHASWAVFPRALMHEMPDRWQARMAVLMRQFFDTYENMPPLEFEVKVRRDGKYAAMPDWVEYRYPKVEVIESFKRAI